jgi:hypothetical protein
VGSELSVSGLLNNLFCVCVCVCVCLPGRYFLNALNSSSQENQALFSMCRKGEGHSPWRLAFVLQNLTVRSWAGNCRTLNDFVVAPGQYFSAEVLDQVNEWLKRQKSFSSTLWTWALVRSSFEIPLRLVVLAYHYMKKAAYIQVRWHFKLWFSRKMSYRFLVERANGIYELNYKYIKHNIYFPEN